MSEADVRVVTSDEEVMACFEVMRQLRPALRDREALAEAVRRQRAEGYRLAAAFVDGRCVGCVGYRVQTNLVYGRHLYVDDLVVDEGVRGSGVGRQLLGFAERAGREEGCAKFVLDTGTGNHRAQRFYYGYGLAWTAIRFSREIEPA